MNVHDSTIHSIETDTSQRKVITACSDGFIRIFRRDPTEPGKEMILESEVNASLGPATRAIFLDGDETCASSYFSGNITVWKHESGKFLKKYEKQILSGSVNSIAGRKIGELFVLYCACSDGNVRILSIDASFNVQEKDVFCHRFGVLSVSLGETDDCFVTGGMDYSTAIWKGGVEVVRFRDHKKFVRDVAVCPTNCFKIFCMASCSEDGTVIIYTKRRDEYETQIIDLKEPCHSLSWSTSGFSLGVGYGKSKFKCFVPDCGKFKEVELRRIEN